MIHELLCAMSIDMNIPRYRNESDESYTYRICYSALGLWCLYAARNSSAAALGTTKHNQTLMLNDLLTRYIELFPDIYIRFVDSSRQQNSFSVTIRRVYEETGYLLTDSNNRNLLANYGRSIQIANEALFFGVPIGEYSVNGLGIFSMPTDYQVSIKDYLIRDDLTSEEYFLSCFDHIDFYDKEVDVELLEFFNPLSNNVPSKSWSKKPATLCSIARKTETGPFYRVIKSGAALLFADEPLEVQSDCLFSHEYRRLYFAMKSHYGNPLKAIVTKYDDMYSKISIGGHLPNREYYFMLLISWPERNAFDKVNFILRNTLLKEAIIMLANIGVEIKGE